MWPSNKTLITASIALSLSLAACSMGKPQERPDSPKDNATFMVDKVDVSVTGQKTLPEISLPVAKTYSFKACMKEMQYSKPILNHEFEITGGDEPHKATSDNTGCVSWSESVEYNHLAPAQWVGTSRNIQAHGIQQGQRVIELALNPWEDAGEALMNKKIKIDVKAEESATAFKAESSQGIWVDDMRLSIDESQMTKEGEVLNVEIRTQPMFSVIKTDKRRVLEPITRGEFRAEIQLINTVVENQKETRRAITQKVVIEKSKISNNALLLQGKVTLPVTARLGQILLGLKLTPLQAPENLGSFEGVFTVGEFDQLKGSFFSRLKAEYQEAAGKKTVEDFLTEKPNWGAGGEIVKDGSAGYQKSQIQVQPLSFTNVGFKTKQGLNREKVFRVMACLTLPIDSKMLRAQEFEVLKVNGSKETLRSDDKGCIAWDDSVQFQYLDNECWIIKPFTISSSNFSMEQKLKVSINPWDEGAGSIRQIFPTSKPELSCATGKSKIVMAQYLFDKKAIQYPIDPFLNIKIQKDGIMKLQARLKRPSLVDGTGFEDVALPPGKYLLRWAIVDQSVQDFSKAASLIYQVQEKWVTIDAAGTISESLSLESANLRSLGNTNSLLLELTPEDKSSNLSVVTYRGPIVLSNPTDSGNLEVVQESNESLIVKLRNQFVKDQEAHQIQMQRLAMKQNFAHDENLALLNLNDEAQTLVFRKALASPLAWQAHTTPALKTIPAVNSEELMNFVKSGKMNSALADRLCAFWFLDHLRRPLASLGNKSMLTQQAGARMKELCYTGISKDPKNFFEIQYRYFLKNASKEKDLSSEIKDLSFGNAFTMSHAQDKSFAKTFSADVNGGFNTGKWFSPVSVGGGMRYQLAWSESERQASANASSIQSGESLLLEKLNFKIHASGYEKCAVVRLRSDVFRKDKSPLLASVNKDIKPELAQAEVTRGLMFCDSSALNKSVSLTESYFIINQKSMFTQAIDPNSDFGRPLFMMIRGLNDFRRMMQILDGKMRAPGSSQAEFFNQQTQKAVLTPAFNQGLATYPGQYVGDE